MRFLIVIAVAFLFNACSITNFTNTQDYQIIEDKPQNKRNYSKLSKSQIKHLKQVGIASYYGPKWNGRRTANGEILDLNKLTAAHKSLPFNTLVKVTNLETGKSIVVRINDRGPYVSGRIIDLTDSAARELGILKKGIAKVKLEVIG